MMLNFLNEINKKKLVVRGAGQEADEFLANWEFYSNFFYKFMNISLPKISYIYDNDPQKQGKYFHGIKIEKPIDKYDENIFIIIAIGKIEIISAELKKLNYQNHIDFEYWYEFINKLINIIEYKIENILLDLADNNLNLDKNKIADVFQEKENLLLASSEIYKSLEKSHLEKKEKIIIEDIFLGHILNKWMSEKNNGFSSLKKYFHISEIITALYNVIGENIEKIQMFYENDNIFRKHSKKIKTIGIFNFRYSNGGTSRVLSQLIPMFISMGYEIILFTDSINENEYFLPEQVKRIILKKWHLFKLRLHLEELMNYIQKYNIDLMFYNNLHFNISSFYEMLFVKCLNLSVITELHNIFFVYINNNVYIANKWSQILKLTDKIITLSRIDKIYWNTFGLNATYIPNPIENGKIYWNLPINFKKRNGKTIIWVGRTKEPSKRLIDTIDIINEVRKVIPNVILKIIGDSNGLLEYRRMIEENNLTNNIELCGYHNDVNIFYEEADVMLMTSEFESFSMILIESKLHGVPTVMYELPYLELTRNAKGIIEVSQRDTKSAADALIKILSNDKLRHTLSIEAKKSLYPFINYDIQGAWQEIFYNI